MAYVAAIAAHAGCNQGSWKVDEDSIDVSLRMDGLHDAKYSSGQIDLQLKCTKRLDAKENEYSFPLSLKNYNDLRAPVIVPRILVVVVVPARIEEWILQSRESLCLKHCGYWKSLAAAPSSENKDSISIKIPSQNIFSSGSLREMMRRMADGEAL